MSQVTTDTITLQCPYADGTAGQAKLYHLAELDATKQTLSTPATLTAKSSQPAIIAAVVNGTDVDIQAVGPKPANIGSATITVTDGRSLQNGSPDNAVTINVTLTAPPDGTALVITSSDAIRNL